MNFKGSRTEKNLMEAFAGESMARNKYSFYANQAKKDGYEQIARIFEETANNEYQHGKLWFKYMHDGVIPNTLTNLEDCSKGEHYEWTQMYQNFANVAREEGFTDLALHFELVATIEKFHNERYDKLIEEIKEKQVFSRKNVVLWECANCGFHILEMQAPEICPVCSHPKAFFFNKNEIR